MDVSPDSDNEPMTMPAMLGDAPFPTDSALARSIAQWLKAAPAKLLVELHDEGMKEQTANQLGELIVSEITMAYPDMVDATAPRFRF